MENVTKTAQKQKKIKIIARTWNDEFELHDVSYSVSDIQDYIKSIKKKYLKFFVITKKLIDKTKDEENVPSLDVAEIVLVQCNIVDNQYQQKSELLYTFTTNKSYAYLLNVEPNTIVFLKTYSTEFDDITITFTDQNGRSLEIPGKVNLKLIINKQE